MGTALATASVADIGKTSMMGNKYQVIGTVAITASPGTYTAGGMTFSLGVPLIKASRTPIEVSFVCQTGYDYVYVPGTNASNGKLKIFVQDATSTNPLAEMGDGTTIPAGVSGDTITFTAIFLGQN